jgi:hypothetical protein
MARAGRERLRVLRTPTREAPVETTDTTKPRAIERWLEGNLPGYRFGYVLLLLLLTYVFMALGSTAPWTRVTTVTLQGLTLLAALRASQVGRRLFRIAALVALVALLSAVASLWFDSSEGMTGAFFALNMLVVAAAPVAIVRSGGDRSSTSTPCSARSASTCSWECCSPSSTARSGISDRIRSSRRPTIPPARNTCTSASSR